MQNEKMNTAAIQGDCGSKSYTAPIGRDRACREMTNEERDRLYYTGKHVLFAPPQECKGDKTPEFYPAIITKVNGPAEGFGGVRTFDLVTFGPNSVYFQHNIPWSPEGIKPGHWFYKD